MRFGFRGLGQDTGGRIWGLGKKRGCEAFVRKGLGNCGVEFESVDWRGNAEDEERESEREERGTDCEFVLTKTFILRTT